MSDRKNILYPPTGIIGFNAQKNRLFKKKNAFFLKIYPVYIINPDFIFVKRKIYLMFYGLNICKTSYSYRFAIFKIKIMPTNS